MKKSLFMQDSSRSNHGYETMLDYQISWLLRLAKEEINDRLHDVARSVLFKLIEKKNDSNVKINRVEVWKQWERIDLTAEIELEVKNQTESFFDRDEERFNSLQKQCNDCKVVKWEPLSFYEVIGWKEGDPDTESDLFNEFWLREWY